MEEEETKEIAVGRSNLLRGIANAHFQDIVTADYAHYLGLIVTGGRDYRVIIWDYERVKMEYEIKAHTDGVVLTKFIKPFPLLLTADQQGSVFLWKTLPGESKSECLIHWRNMFTLQKMCPITSMDYHWDGQILLIILGDEMGHI